MENPLDAVVRGVTQHSALVVVVMLVLTAGVAVGVTKLDASGQSNAEAPSETEAAQKYDYVTAHYGNGSDAADDASPAAVYVRGDNVLSKAALLDSLRYQRRVTENASVAGALAADRGVVGVANVVGRQAAGDPDATLDEQIAALEAASPDEVREIVRRTLTADSPALALLPSDYQPGTATATSRRMVFRFETGPDGSAAAERRSRAQAALHEAAGDRASPEYFTLGEHATRDAQRTANGNLMEFVVPVSLLVILAVLAFAYRDLVDIVVGFAGVVISVVWMFGILGWLGVSAGMTSIVGPVLVVGLSVDYGLHVFMRYREQRDARRPGTSERRSREQRDAERPETSEAGEGVRPPMRRSLSSVAVALALVTVTTAVGFLSNLANELASIRSLAVGITLGVVSAFVVFVTLVPALKVAVDGLLERAGFDRRKRPLGKQGVLRPVLVGGVAAAQRAAPVVLVLALVVGAAGAVSWTALDRQAFQQGTDDVAEWKQDLPEPLAWDVPEYREHRGYVDAHYRSPDADQRSRSQILVQGDVTSPDALERVHDARVRAAESGVAFERGGTVPVRSPVTVMESVAARDDAFAETYRAADTDGDGVPDRNLEAVYDALYDAAPGQAATVVERTDGEYRSVRLIVPVRADAASDEQADAMRDAAAVADGDGLDATAVGRASVVEAEAARIADGILTTLLVALAAVLVVLAAAYRLVEGSATLGAVTAAPVALVTALVVGGMYVLDVPLTLVTALLMSLVVGLGIDYNIHVSDRFAHELAAGRAVYDALTEAVTGTGGALLGSTLTSTGAFGALLLTPYPQLRSFGTLVVLALGVSFVVSVFVLPSLLALWARYAGVTGATTSGRAAPQD